MEIEYTDFIIYAIIFLVSCIFSIYFLDAISNHIFEKYASKFDEQIELYKSYSQKALDTKIAAINIQPMVQVEIFENFQHINDEMLTIHARISDLNRICETREDLENEIVKLKNIIKRKDKRL